MRFLFLLLFLLGFGVVIPQNQNIDYQLTQPQILIRDGHIYFVPAQGRNLVLSTGGGTDGGKILFNDVDMRSILSSLQNSSRDLDSLRRIMGNPTNSSFGGGGAITFLHERMNSMEHRMDLVDHLDERLTTVERQLVVGNTTDPDAGSGGRSVRNRLRRLARRVEAIERRLRRSGGASGENPCYSNPCGNGGSCIPTSFGAYCMCPEGWEGDTCQQDVNECANFAGTDLGCQNGATCTNRPGSYECRCRSGWMGVHCTKRQGDCSSGTTSELCGHGVCVNQHSGSRPFTCICEQGWKTDGINPACQVEVNECDTGHALCSTNPPVVCINTPGSYVCGPCPPGYSGNGHRCVDINECLMNNGGCSTNPMVQCINTPGSRTCGECPPGYIGNGVSCQYVGMCAVNNGGCHPLARCVENPVIGQSFVQCVCPAGYTGTGMGLHGCYPYGGGGGGSSVLPGPVPATQPCNPNPCMNNGACQAHGNAFTCTCLPGFAGPTCAVRISACLSNPCQNGGTCVEQPPSFICHCPQEYTGARCEEQVRACGGHLNSPEGVLTFPHDESTGVYRNHMHCEWVIRTELGYVLNITFTRMHVEGYSGTICPHDSLTIRDGYNALAPVLGRYCGDELPNNGNPLITTHDAAHLVFDSDHSIVGLGFELVWNTTEAVCGGVITNRTHGSISSPGYPGNYPHNRDCEWLIAVSPGKRIQLAFATFRIEEHNNCSYDYLAVRDGWEENGPVLAYYCNTTLPPPLESSGSYISIRFHTDDSSTDSGFHITFSEVPGVPGCGGLLTSPTGVITTPQYPEPYGHNLECDWIIRMTSREERINLKFTTFQLEGGGRITRTCRFDYVEIRDGNSPESNLVGRFCGSNAPPDMTSTGNQLLIKFKSDGSAAYGGFSARYEAACGGLFSSPEGMLRSTFYPNRYPVNRECIFIISQPVGKGILLDFIDFDIESGFGTRCLFDFLEVRDGDTENSTLIGHFCGPPDATPPRIVSTHNYLWLKFKTDGSVSNRGFLANYSSYDTGCGGIIRDTHGTISSPGHPEVYPHGVTCIWVLRGDPGQVIRLTWSAFALESSPTCRFDHVQVWDNSTFFRNGTNMGRFCGHSVPPTLTSSDNTMTIVFRSDRSVSHDGFMANFIMINTSLTCGGEYFSEFGIIRSPRYPESYPNRRNCEWKISVPTGKQIRLNISDFALENGSRDRCNYDYLEIRNGGYSTSPLIGKFCGNHPPPSILPSLTNALYLKFVSDSSTSARGFLITWDGTATGCGGALTAPSGSVTSPNYPQSVGSYSECTWSISVNQGSLIQLVFVDLDLMSSPSCWGEFVEIRDGPDARAPLIGKYCHSDSVLTLNSTQNQVWIKYLSGYGGTGRGFQINYRAGCNRVIEGSFHGVIESPNFPKSYPQNRNCTWELRAPKGNTLNVSFSHFDVEGPRRNMCAYDFVEFKEWSRFNRGPPPTPTSLGKFCGNQRPPSISSTKDTLTLNFVSDYSHGLNGFRVEWKVHGCGGKLFGSYTSIRTPNYPNKAPHEVICIWQVTTEIGTKVELTIFDMQIENHQDCRFDGLEVYGGPSETSPLLTKLCHSATQPQTISSHGNNMYIKFYTDDSVPSKGLSATTRAAPGGCGGRFKVPKGNIYSPNYPSNYDHNDDCGWVIEVEKGHSIELQFTDFSVERHINCTFDHVAVYDGYSERDPLLIRHCGSELPSPSTVRSTGNYMYIRLKTDGSSSSRGFKANFTQACGSRITSVSSYSRDISTPNWPAPVLYGTQCTWTIVAPEEEHVTLTFTHMNMDPLDDIQCNTTFVQVLDGEDNEAPSVGRYCSTRIPPSITSAGNALTIKFSARGRSRGFGFRAVYDFASSACGFTNTLTSPNGSFTSPNYPNGYPPNSECIWLIKAPAGNRVHLSFRSFGVESSDFCNQDFVEIHENDAEGRLLGHFCGDQEVPSNVSSANALWIMFRTDGEGNAPGFWVDYNLEYGIDLSDSSGAIESPGYPLYQSIISGTYTWRITVNETQAIQLTFTDVDLPNYQSDNNDCIHFSILEVFDGFDNEAPSLLSTCQANSIDPLTSTGNVLFIRYDMKFHLAKWRLTWQEIQPPEASQSSGYLTNVTGCGGNFSIVEGNATHLYSPYYPMHYPNNIRCVWTINSPPHTRILVNISDFDMESNVACFYDKLEFWDGHEGFPNYVLNKTICHRAQMNGSMLISSGRYLQIIMTTDLSTTRRGFNLTLMAVCGGYSREPRGRLTSPGFPGNYVPSLCDWTIIIRPGRTIQTRFERFDIYSDGTGCVTDEIILRNGATVYSPFLGTGRYCGSTKPQLPETSGNKMHITFRAWTSNRGGFSLVYEEVSAGCGGEIYLTNGAPNVLISSPNFPQMPPPFTECEWLVSAPQGEAVQITFQISFDFKLSAGCSQAGIEIRDGGTEMSPQVGLYCREMPSSITSTGNIMYIRYYTNVPEPKTGFKAEVRIAKCGGTITGWTQYIQSPGYPGGYETNLNCTWTIRTTVGTTIQLPFLELDLGSSPRRVTIEGANTTELQCLPDKDRVVVIEPDERGLFARPPRNWTICDRLQAYTSMISSSSNELIVNFISDGTSDRGKKGFRFMYTARFEPCGGDFSSPSGIISTPNYPSPYPHYRHCTWRIRAPEDRRVRLEFLDFDLEETYTARGRSFCYDSVSVYQGRWRDLPRLYNRTLCGASLPPPVESTQNEIMVFFASDNSVRHRGFRARYTTDLPASCGGILPSGNGSIIVPSGNITTGTPNTTTNILCHWRTASSLNSGNGTTIVSITDLKIPPWATGSNPLCPSGFLHITPGGYGYSNPYAYQKYCGIAQNVKLYIPGTDIKVDYETSFPSSSFSLEYSVSPCGERLSGPFDNVTSPGFPGNYPANTECIWTLEYQSASQIRVHFLELDLDDHRGPDNECDRDYVLIRNGKYQTSPVLGKWCGNNPPPDILSMSSHLWIEFHSDGNSDQGKRGFSLSTEKVTRGCGGILHTKYGMVSSPTVSGSTQSYTPSQGTRGKYPPNTECEWIIETVPGYKINLKFDGRFDIEQSTNCTNDYVEITQKGETEAEGWKPVGRYCGRQQPSPINTTATTVKVRFVSNGNLDGDGFNLVWYSPCGGLFTAPSGIVRSAHYSRLNHSTSLNTENYWSYVGWESTWDTKRCDYVIRSPSESDFVLIEFLPPFDISVPAPTYGARDSDVNAECPEVNMTMWQGNLTNEKLRLGPYCGQQGPPAFLGKGQVTLSYNYRPNYQNEGFRARYSIFSCGGRVTTPTLISSPGHPFTSAPFMNCTWRINSGSQNKVVRFRLEKMELEFHGQCSYDFVKVFDGPDTRDDKLLGTFCGNMTLDYLHPILSRGREMTVQFVTDWSVQHSGFQAAVDFTPGESQGCGGQRNVSSEHVEIRSLDQDGDGKYDVDLDCQWLIGGPDFESLQVTFETFQLEGSSNVGNKNMSLSEDDQCPYDFVELRDGPGPFAQLLGKFCGSQVPPAITSSRNFIWVRFKTDASNNYPGFRATVTSRESPCGRNLILNATRGEFQELSSPGYPSPYGQNVRCKWTVDGASFFDEVDIKFIELDIESSSNCENDRIEIKDMSTSYTTPEGISGPILFVGNGPVDWRHRHVPEGTEILQDVRYCGSQTPPDFFSVGRSVEFVFHTDGTGTGGRGFKIQYKAAGCNRTYEAKHGRIFSPEFPGYSPIFSNCQFSIRGGNGTTVALYFNKFILPGPAASTSECAESAMEFHDATPTGKLLGKSCGTALPDPIFSTSNIVWVQYFTRIQLSLGYDITYTTTTDGRGCGGDIFHTGGSFTSPLYPGNYSRDSDCRWKVRVPGGLVVQLKFTDFMLGSSSCETDFVEVFYTDYHVGQPTLFSRYCAEDTISPYTAPTDMIEVRYKTSPGNTGVGWRAEFKGVRSTRLPPS